MLTSGGCLTDIEYRKGPIIVNAVLTIICHTPCELLLISDQVKCLSGGNAIDQNTFFHFYTGAKQQLGGLRLTMKLRLILLTGFISI